MSMTTSSIQGLGSLFSKKLESSLLSLKEAARLHLKPVLADKAPDWLPFKAAGFSIPYFDINGKVTQFSRYRYLEQPKREGFAALLEYKPLRYAQPQNTVNEVYMPPFTKWAEIAKRPDIPIIVTEGELKSACATLHTPYAALGLGGVWCFRSAKNNLPLLPQFRAIEWKTRKVYIIFDSDAAANVNVMMAENALARELTKLGAAVYIGRIPATPGAKQGLDDIMLAKGAGVVDTLIEAAVQFQENEELFRLNEEVSYVRQPGLILRLDNMQKLSPKAFTDHAYATRSFSKIRTDDKGNVKMEERAAAKEWIKWPHRAEVKALTYKPGAPRVLETLELNLWPGWNVEPKKGDITPWKQLIKHLFGEETESATWFERWCAYPLQHPGIKMYTSALLWGRVHGTGKSFVGYSLFKIYGRNSTEVTNEHLHAAHNEWAENKQFVMGDEITGSDKRNVNDRMKTLITQQSIRLNPKYIPSYEIPDCINYLFTSNHNDSFFVEEKDRRNFIHEVIADPLPQAFYTEYEKWIGSPGTVGPGAAALFYHLLNLDTGDFNPRARAPETQSKLNMIANGRSDIGDWVARLRDEPDAILKYDNQPIKFCLWTSEELLVLYDPERKGRLTANGLTREMNRAGFRHVYNGQTVPTSAGNKRLWIIRQLPAYLARASRDIIGAHYDRERTTPTQNKGKFK
jgi:hypothetical protein